MATVGFVLVVIMGICFDGVRGSLYLVVVFSTEVTYTECVRLSYSHVRFDNETNNATFFY